MKPTIEDLVAAYAAGKSIRYSTSSGFAELAYRKQGYPQGASRYGFRHTSHTTESKPLSFLTRSPEESIRAALTTPRNDKSLRTLEIWDKVAETTAEPVSPPPAPLVPLGANRTRDGRKARVLCNDRANFATKPVVALVWNARDQEEIYSFEADGRVSTREESSRDLVGHLPPEPAKPREFWINHYPNNDSVEYCVHVSREEADEKASNRRAECVHAREVLPGEADELELLRGWKRQAMANTPDWQAIGNEIGLTLGQDVPSEILPYILRLKKFIGDLRQPAVSAQVELDAAFLLEP